MTDLSSEPQMKWKAPRRCNYYDLLGVPQGASIEHIKASYRLLTVKTVITDIAYRTLSDPDLRREYDASLGDKSGLERSHSQGDVTKDAKDWGRRGRERCSCGTILGTDDEWLCQECWGNLNYFVVFDMSGGHILHESSMFETPDSETQSSSQASSDSVAFGPFTRYEAESFLEEKNRMRAKRTH
jgi:curved DNA-binding protein CbpA